MTTIVYRDGVMAADSCETIEEESAGDHVRKCAKLFRYDGYLIGLQGESTPGMVFLNWFTGFKGMPGVHTKRPDELVDSDADFTALVVTPRGQVFEFDRWCIATRRYGGFHAVGSGVKAALGALHMGASAPAAVRIAAKIDPYTRGPVHVMRLK